jgi:SAM-dependent methyltransferase
MIDSPLRVRDVEATGECAIVLETVACPLCGEERWSTILEGPDVQSECQRMRFTVTRCGGCGLCWTNPRPTAQSIGWFYPDRYRPHRPPRRQGWWQRLPFVGKRVLPEHRPLRWHGEGRLLDFGCGGGRFLVRMRDAGWQVAGVDFSGDAVEAVRDLGIPCVQGSLPHSELAERSFDVITMMHSLEHVHDPLEVLRAAHDLLAPGGKLIVAVPNLDSLPFRWFGTRWFGLDLPRHLTHFTPRTLSLMLHRAGFEPGPVRMIRHAQWTRASAQLACRFGDAARWQRRLRLRPFAWLASWYAYLTKQSDAMMITAFKS